MVRELLVRKQVRKGSILIRMTIEREREITESAVLSTKSGENCESKIKRLTKSLKKATAETYTDVIQQVDRTPQENGSL